MKLPRLCMEGLHICTLKVVPLYTLANGLDFPPTHFNLPRQRAPQGAGLTTFIVFTVLPKTTYTVVLLIISYFFFKVVYLDEKTIPHTFPIAA